MWYSGAITILLLRHLGTTLGDPAKWSARLRRPDSTRRTAPHAAAWPASRDSHCDHRHCRPVRPPVPHRPSESFAAPLPGASSVVCEGSAGESAPPRFGAGSCGRCRDRTVSGRSECGGVIGENGRPRRPVVGGVQFRLRRWIAPPADAETRVSGRRTTRRQLREASPRGLIIASSVPLAPSRLLPTFPVGGGPQ